MKFSINNFFSIVYSLIFLMKNFIFCAVYYILYQFLILFFSFFIQIKHL